MFIYSLQYYHTVTAVRRADVSKSPMTKVMDLFRHRSNSAVSEADKRKAVSLFEEEDENHRHCSHLTCRNFLKFSRKPPLSINNN